MLSVKNAGVGTESVTAQEQLFLYFGKFGFTSSPYNVRDFNPENVGSPGVAMFVFWQI